MNGTTLKAIRVSLGFSQQEAADMIGAVQMRTWRYWEDADRAIPDDVVSAIRGLSEVKHHFIGQLTERIEAVIDKNGESKKMNLSYYTNLDDWMTQDLAEPMHWRPHQMAMASLAEAYPSVRLIKFDPVAYQAWLAGRTDNSAMRGQWAALQQ